MTIRKTRLPRLLLYSNICIYLAAILLLFGCGDAENAHNKEVEAKGEALISLTVSREISRSNRLNLLRSDLLRKGFEFALSMACRQPINLKVIRSNDLSVQLRVQQPINFDKLRSTLSPGQVCFHKQEPYKSARTRIPEYFKRHRCEPNSLANSDVLPRHSALLIPRLPSIGFRPSSEPPQNLQLRSLIEVYEETLGEIKGAESVDAQRSSLRCVDVLRTSMMTIRRLSSEGNESGKPIGSGLVDDNQRSVSFDFNSAWRAKMARLFSLFVGETVVIVVDGWAAQQLYISCAISSDAVHLVFSCGEGEPDYLLGFFALRFLQAMGVVDIVATIK